MTQIWNLVRKDFRHFCGRWAFWVTAVALKTLLGLWLLLGGALPDDPLRWGTYGLTVLVPTEVALTILLTMLIVQDDPPQGGQPLWRTRPISGARLLLAKVITLFLMLGLPVVVLAVPLWLVAGAGPADLVWAALGQLALQAVVIVPVAAMAALTRTPGRFLIGSLVGFLVIPMALSEVLAGNSPEASSGQLATVALMLALGAAAVICYLERRVWRIVAVAGLASLLLAATVALAARDGRWTSLVARLASARELNPGKAAGISLEFESITGPIRFPRGNDPHYNVSVKIGGVPDDLCLMVQAAEQQLSWPDGRETLTARSLGWGAGAMEQPLLRQVLRLAVRTPGQEKVLRRFLSLRGNPQAFTRLAQEPATYQLTAPLALLRPDVGLTFPLADRGWHSRQGRGMRVLRLDDRQNGTSGVDLLAAEFLYSPGVGWAGLLPGARAPAETLARAVLIDRRRGELKSVVARDQSSLLIAGLRIFSPLLIASLSEQERAAGTYEVVWIRWEQVARVTRGVRSENVRLPGLP